MFHCSMVMFVSVGWVLGFGLSLCFGRLSFSLASASFLAFSAAVLAVCSVLLLAWFRLYSLGVYLGKLSGMAMGIGSSESSSSLSVPVSVLLGFGSSGFCLSSVVSVLISCCCCSVVISASVVGLLLVSGSGFVSVWGLRCGRNWGWMGIFLFFVASGMSSGWRELRSWSAVMMSWGDVRYCGDCP